MTAFIIISMILFFLSMVSNVLFILNENTSFKGGAIFGLIVFTFMFAWGSFILLQ